MKDYCTVFQAETAAIKHAAEELITFNNQQITFWSDSLSALQALSNKIHNNKSINDCHKALTKLADENTVHLKGGGGGHPDYFVKLDFEIAVDQQTRARDRTFEGVPDSG